MSVVIYSLGIVHASVCAPAAMEPAEVTEAVNAASPTGIRTAWELSEEAFATGEPNPAPCDTDPARRHYLFTC